MEDFIKKIPSFFSTVAQYLRYVPSGIIFTSVVWWWHFFFFCILDSTICFRHYQWHLLGNWFAQTAHYSRCQNPTQTCKHPMASILSWLSCFASQNAGNLWYLSWSRRFSWIYERMHNHWHTILFIRCRSEQGYEKVRSACKSLSVSSRKVNFNLPLSHYDFLSKLGILMICWSSCNAPLYSTVTKKFYTFFLIRCLSLFVLQTIFIHGHWKNGLLTCTTV